MDGTTQKSLFSSFTEGWLYLLVVFLATCLKILLIPTYISTDFDVHRNWLAITNSLPISKWYFEATSEWTLDYPPFFAYFEYVLSLFSSLLDGKMLEISKDPYRSTETIFFQRISVIVTDLLYLYSIYKYVTNTSLSSIKERISTFALLVLNVGLLFVDHIHFQYNGMLMGIFIYSITQICKGNEIQGAMAYAILLNFKHIFLYVAPVYFFYLLKYYCFTYYPENRNYFSFKKFIILGLAVSSVFIISLGPFLFLGQIGQLLSRLFPFSRGLSHAYWAPNFWAIYNFSDKVAIIVYKWLKWNTPNNITGNMTGGLVQNISHAILPTIHPIHTNILTLLFYLPLMFHLFSRPNGSNFKQSIVVGALTFYMFGWHVHEKAILTAIIPLGLLIAEGPRFGRFYFLLSTVGHYSLFPLLFQYQEIPIRIVMHLLYSFGCYFTLHSMYSPSVDDKTKRVGDNLFQIKWFEKLYLFGLSFVELLHILKPLYEDKFPFLPLLTTSVYCSIGIVYIYINLYINLLNS